MLSLPQPRKSLPPLQTVTRTPVQRWSQVAPLDASTSSPDVSSEEEAKVEVVQHRHTINNEDSLDVSESTDNDTVNEVHNEDEAHDDANDNENERIDALPDITNVPTPLATHPRAPVLVRSRPQRVGRVKQSVTRTFTPLLASATAIATPRKQLKVWKLRLPLVCNVALILAFVLLDVQDLFYKVFWVGSNESFSFRTEVTGVLREDVALIPRDANYNSSTPEPIDVDRHESSWPHFLSSCTALHAMDAGGGFFAIALGSNCTVGVGDAQQQIEHMAMGSAVRLDSIVWTACKLLFQSQQPFICRSPVATKFLRRYLLADIYVPISSLAAPGSVAEHELLAFLDMVSNSYPLHKMVCVEAFDWPNRSVGAFKSILLGCASPNLRRSAFIGLSNPVVRDLHTGRAWLTSDAFHWFGLHFGIRQNARNTYLAVSTPDGGLRMTGHTTPNFSCYGPLYSLMMALDVLLFVANACSYWQLVERVLVPRSNELVRRHRRMLRETTKMILPQRTRRRLAQADLVQRTATRTAFRPSVHMSARSKLIATLEQLSWVPLEHLELRELKQILPCSLQRSWPGIVAVMVSQLLSWIIILPNSVVWVWGLSLTTKVQAFLTSLRVWMLLVVTCNLLWDGVVMMSEEWAYAVTSRTFLTPVEIVVVGGAVAAWKRLDIFLMCERKWAIEKQRVNDASAFAGGFVAHGNTYPQANEALMSTPREILAILYGPLVQIISVSIVLLVAYLPLKAAVLHHLRARKPAVVLSPEQLCDGQYTRLPMEVEANCPIRAKSLVRVRMAMEHTHGSQQYIRPECYLECGLLPLQTRFTTRVGFPNFLPLKYQKRARILEAKEDKDE